MHLLLNYEQQKADIQASLLNGDYTYEAAVSQYQNVS